MVNAIDISRRCHEVKICKEKNKITKNQENIRMKS